MPDDSEFAVDSLTLPELITAAEHARRRIVEHLQFDVLPKARDLSESKEVDPGSVLHSHEFSRKMLAQWEACCSGIQQRINQILDEP